MKVSVIIPVYKAEKYVKRAVESALRQKECGEVILVEDRSPDKALEVCRELCRMSEKVSLYQHENNQNKGPGPSRNLGALKAKYDHIAFLDADDIYLLGRFTKSSELLLNNASLDGIYEPVGSSFENEEAKRRFFVAHSDEVAMVKKEVEPENLFECLISGRYGYIHPNGLLLKKKAFIDVGMFPELRLHEDTILNLKLALLCRLSPGETQKPVSIRLLHMDNTITKPGLDFLPSQYLALENLLGWMKVNDIAESRKKMIEAKYYQLKYRALKKQGKMFIAILYYLYYHAVQKKHAFWDKQAKQEIKAQ
jgi:glycosyltransferase involved in cell wall biosynthesis